MADPQVSPISQLLYTLGITREDLNKRSDQMRQFLTADDVNSLRVSERDNGCRSRSNSDLRSGSKSRTSTSSLARSVSCASSNSLRDTSPPTTPVKVEPHESGVPLRQYDSMEMVIERQRRQSRREKKIRRNKEREPPSLTTLPHPPSPSPSNASQSGLSLDSFMQSRDDRRVPNVSMEENAEMGASQEPPPPVTPHKHKYYRDHTNLSSTSQSRKEVSCKPETPTPTRSKTHPTPQSQPVPQYYAYPLMGYPQYLPVAYRQAASTSAPPVTPQLQRTHPPSRKMAQSPLPPSSPPPASSPLSSPIRRVVNLVSSPGPMGPAPVEEEYDRLPYTLPPGPYSPNKPDMSYAALVGQAILSSPEHRLTLQEIYDWITIVFPHYKRGETTWMNSIRHVLSTTVCFRKVPRERSVGRTLWAIWDEDLECFKGGGFRKQLCKDIANSNDFKEKHGSSSRGKAKGRKRADDDEGAQDAKKPKRAKKEQHGSSTRSSESISAQAVPQYTVPPPLASHPLFPPTRPTPHHQPYYESCVTQPHQVPADIIFPPLPAAAAFNRVMAKAASSNVVGSKESGSSPQCDPSAPMSDASSVMSVPELTPNRTSSSPPSSLPATSDMDIDLPHSLASGTKGVLDSVSVTISNLDDEIDTSASGDTDDREDNVFNTSLLGPVQFWGETPKSTGGLQPGIELFNFESSDDDELLHVDKKRRETRGKLKGMTFPPVPTSPTMNGQIESNLPPSDPQSNHMERPSTPPPLSGAPPSTPPRTARKLHLSSVRTPLSHKGLHMSPSASLLHYKSNLDPPPTLNYDAGPSKIHNAQEHDVDLDGVDTARTPRRRTSSTGNVFPPVTPKKLNFLAGPSESPFRTPMAGSPFRTPGSRPSIFDPHDPRTVLDDELSRMGNSYEDSPGGLFGKGRGTLLYDSPGYDKFDSPGKWNRWW